MWAVMYYPIHNGQSVCKPLLKFANEGTDWYVADWVWSDNEISPLEQRLSYHIEFDEFEVMTTEDVRMYVHMQ